MLPRGKGALAKDTVFSSRVLSIPKYIVRREATGYWGLVPLD